MYARTALFSWFNVSQKCLKDIDVPPFMCKARVACAAGLIAPYVQHQDRLILAPKYGMLWQEMSCVVLYTNTLFELVLFLRAQAFYSLEDMRKYSVIFISTVPMHLQKKSTILLVQL
jgi:hypothetical protein